MYQKPELLDQSTHGQLRYTAQNTYHFARLQTTAPLLSEEIAEASAYYPIVFATDGSARPLARRPERALRGALDRSSPAQWRRFTT